MEDGEVASIFSPWFRRFTGIRHAWPGKACRE
jgi:hypothetical protein